ncbi:hypothetical protein [Gelidibacter sp. F63206]|uniref:hypothetical protein n=1 Tax=Gelidibacter sp. F63206 TaxID=2926425 RepID=UPI001FF21049|nr:hypothetical protein [Gelidibacter sp. F63206]MCK0114823.1 hypothetical protein [Gelidibacter sp. F63206]
MGDFDVILYDLNMLIAMRIKSLASIFHKLFLGDMFKAQNDNPLSWRFLANRQSAHTYTIHISAFIKSPWQLYTEQLNHLDSSLLTIEFNKSEFIILNGNIEEIDVPIERYDELLNHEIRCYKVAVNFVQIVHVVDNEAVILKGVINCVVGDGISHLKTGKELFKIEFNKNCESY